MSWEVSIMELESKEGKQYKVTRRIPGLSISETKVFSSKDDARRQFELWLN